MSGDKKAVAETKLTLDEEKKKAAAETKLTLDEEKNLGFLIAMSKTNTEKITKEILEGLSEDTGDSDSYDVDSGSEDSEDRPWRPSHSVYGKSTIKENHLVNMRGRYFRDLSIVRADEGEKTCPHPEENEVVVYRSFLKAGLRFPLSNFIVEVLKIFEVYLHQLTPEAIIRLNIFAWAARSQGLKPDAKSFCNIHELLYETKPWGKEQYHNNFGCYSFVSRSGASCPVPTFRKRWPGDWMTEWFYVKNDLSAREDIKGIIMRPIWQSFGLRRPKVEMSEAAEECQRAFGLICSFIGTRDLVQEHIAFRVWPLAEKWEMPQETIKEADEGGLVRLKYTFKFGDKFAEPDDDWLKSIENLSDELLGAYSKAEDTAMSAAFGGRKKKRLNRVFDAIGFVYPDYCYPVRRPKRKNTTSVKEEAATAPSEPEPERKRIKVLTHRPRYIEPASVPEFTEKSSSATEAKKPINPATPPAAAEITETPKRIEPEEPKVLLPETKEVAEAPSTEKIAEVEKPTVEKVPEIVSPAANVEAIKNQKVPAVTPKRKRMANVLDVLETIKSSSTPSKKAAAILKTATEISDTKTPEQKTEAEAESSEPVKIKSLETEEEKITKPISVEEIVDIVPEASSKVHDYIVRHASGKKLSEKEKQEAQHYAQKLKYPKGALIFNGSGEEDFLYCLPDSKEISVCREMSKSFGFPTLEDGLSVLSKNDLADSLAYNSLKVQQMGSLYSLMRPKNLLFV
jgi:hypothetical protein